MIPTTPSGCLMMRPLLGHHGKPAIMRSGRIQLFRCRLVWRISSTIGKISEQPGLLRGAMAEVGL